MDSYHFSHISEQNLRGVHSDLVKVVRLALRLSQIDFRVIEGMRNMARQRQLVSSGKSQTLNSRHLTGHAVDLAPWVNHSIPWQDWDAFVLIAKAMKKASAQSEIPLVWGGDWKTLKDGPHFELTREKYP
ncbi:M15 family metallopeptidase [Erwinia amylovora]|uniref:L-alanyl-D-glutamate peptidase n=4 Tax=Erwinia amylovora TaxID=552 RepID=A0A830ZV77_ERWAM|nr:M15 family metallopeptidase [Erwinia amylovora]CBX80359.1 L-alanyl-D-glutamate peptidase [Erwinia amylovora ATCC BAA-2158]CDK15003.1 L-alanyl-D-glutamate peptidase (EC 3,4.-.-) [Erwinia amylovora LA635]CDK18371.1 L-alanyl-D-glutamate peptidase (EC 3,4.-.-) [Erwinia amylovora LA636]CDK21740.1 L-alanyl-D-glutamate peptidase (EC 3,4.-.-) [Erwinia amylovora LA637]ATZ13271.1 peptidase M15 [Erwinia amylovora]